MNDTLPEITLLIFLIQYRYTYNYKIVMKFGLCVHFNDKFFVYYIQKCAMKQSVSMRA